MLMEGTYNEIQASDLDFENFLLSSVDISNNAVDDESSDKNNGNCNVDPKFVVDRQASVRSITSSKNGQSKLSDDYQKPTEVAESRSSGNVSFSVYLTYLFAGGRKYKIIFFIFICILTQVLLSSGDLWITFWYYSATFLWFKSFVLNVVFLGIG